MQVEIEPSWGEVLADTFRQPYFHQLTSRIREAYEQRTCYPRGSEIFRAFELSPFKETRVVIIGQDPYHGPGQAHGLCFSVREGVSFPPSLVNIFREIEQDLGIPRPANGDLSRWGKQGVLLLNATLTVEKNKAGSHQGMGWETFTDTVIEVLNREREGLVFLLWGGFARKKAGKLDRDRHRILESGHPSPLSANRGLWFGNKHFSQTNTYLQSIGKKAIEWG